MPAASLDHRATASGRPSPTATALVQSWHRLTGDRPQRRAVLWGYLAVVSALAIGSGFASPLLSSALRMVIAALATTALVAGVRWYRPDFPIGWWLIAIGTGGGALAVAATTLSVAATGDARPDEWAYALLAGLQYPLFIAGLVILARLGRARTADLLDSAILALATFLVLFSLVIHPILPGGPFALVVAVIFPLGALLLFAMTIRVALSVGVPTLALGLLLLAMCARVGSTVSMLVPALTTGSLQVSVVTRPLSVVSYILLGAAALHPSLARTRYRRQTGDDTVSRRRIAMLALTAVIVPVALLAEIRLADDVDTAGVTVPVLVAAALLVLLVGRLGLTAGTAQRRAAELAQRSDDLAEAVREQETLQQQLRYQAMHDPMTGLANRFVLSERLEWVFSRPSGGRQHALALFDLDRFKDVNEALGHSAGDELLVDVSHRLLAAAPPGVALVARLGGDEFAVLIEDTPAAQARQWAARAREVIRRPYRVAGQELHLTVSVGLLSTEPDGPSLTPSDALRDADLALYAAKAAGRDQIRVFRPEMRTAQLNTSRLSTGLRQALANREFAVHYQPMIDLRTGQPVAAEALLRWQPPGLPPVPPSEFIPVAEEIGLIGAIGGWVIRQACRDARAWHERYGISVAVNVSARQLEDPSFADEVLGALAEAGLPGSALILEITESTLVTTTAASDTVAQLDRLRAHRVRLAIDDFGTGYSSLAYVARLPVDIVKLDASFIQQQSTRDGRGWTFTRAVLHLVDALRLQTVAEGVETQEQAETLRGLACQVGQGYLFGKPMPAELLDRTLSRLRPAGIARQHAARIVTAARGRR